MNTDNFNTWLAALRDGTRKQGKMRLATVHQDDTVSYCCMGIGCAVAEIEVRASEYSHTDAGTGDTYTWLKYGHVEASDLPPDEFVEWLDLATATGDNTWHMYLGDQGPEPYDLKTKHGDYIVGAPLATLNDEWGLTFPQIADLLDYFGVRAR
jgi:hypothetical protein